MPRVNPRYGDSVVLLDDKFVMIDGYNRNLALEEKLQSDYDSIKKYRDRDEWSTPIPAGWEQIGTGINKGGGWRREGSVAGVNVTDQEAINYLELVLKILSVRVAQLSYQCEYYPRGGSSCQHASQQGGMINNVERLLKRVKLQKKYPNIPEREIMDNPDIYTLDEFQFFPEASAEVDPSINSGLNGYEQESILYPQSANVGISFTSNVGGFSTSIPINDIGQLQILSNESNEWRYTLIGSSTNQPLMSLSGLINKINSQVSIVITPQPQPQPPQLPPIEEPPITTDHVDPPFPPAPPEPPMVTPTEPGQVNWIPEPFFSFINNVFRR